MPNFCCPRLRLDKVLRNEDVGLLLVCLEGHRNCKKVQSRRRVKMYNEVSLLERKKESVTKMQGRGVIGFS